MAAAAFALGSTLVATAAALLAASLRQRSVAAFLLAAYLLAVAELVGLAELLSLFHAVTRHGYLGGVAVVAAIAGALWWGRGRPRPPAVPLSRVRELRSHPLLLALGAVVTLGLVYELVVGVTTPPNNWDSLWHHLVRVAAWRQYHAVETIPNANAGLGINGDAPDAELQILFGMVLLGRDTFATIPQFLAECSLLVSVFGIARRVGFPGEASAFTALLTATLSEVALQAVTTQNDLVVAGVVAPAVFFVLGRSRLDMGLAGLAVGLALGTKLTALLAVPAIALVALAAGGVRRVIAVGASSAVGFAAFGAFIYIGQSGNVNTVTGVSTGEGSIRAQLSLTNVVATTARVVYRFVDFSGFQHVFHSAVGLTVLLFALPLTGIALSRSWAPSILLAMSTPLIGFVLSVVGIASFLVLHLLHVPTNPHDATNGGKFTSPPPLRSYDSTSYFGPVGMLLLWPLSVWGCVAWARRKADRKIAALAAALPIYVLAYAATLSWSPFAGRYFISAVGIVMPLGALVYRRQLLARALALLGITGLILVHAFNEAKPIGLAGTTPIWSLTRNDALALERPAMRTVLKRVARQVPENAHIGVLLDGRDWSYPFFGAHLNRTLTYLTPTNIPHQTAANHLDWLIIHQPPWQWHIIKTDQAGS